MGRQNNKIEKFDNTFSATTVSNRKNWCAIYPANDLSTLTCTFYFKILLNIFS